ncbi:hypothetical protein E2C01_040576 [Portunus trituberculatus]|uniref:Uncharacterized protein n=1 Tax=Portunus trituberculatus TaxID=210409 RepID=A0A5B7FMV9_PORTR|nr:hypothetical protein [Portunus trituberculatus]
MHGIRPTVRHVQFGSEDFNPCSPGASQDYLHGIILNKLQGTELGSTKLYQNRGDIFNEELYDRYIEHS